MTYDIAIIGAGMFGTAAAKYTSELGHKTVLIGLSEPQLQDYNSHSIFGAHYDQGRICLSLTGSPVLSYLNKRSIARYRRIGQLSGMQFFNECGYLFVVNSSQLSHLYDLDQVAHKLQISYQLIDNAAELVRTFPNYLRTANLVPNMVGFYENRNAGILNPRIYLQAQKHLATAKFGADYLDTSATTVNRSSNGALFCISTKNVNNKNDNKNCIYAEKIILSCGAFLPHNPRLLPLDVGKQPKLIYASTTACRIPVEINANPTDMLISSNRLPCLSYPALNNADLIYAVPPILYPDGKYYLKLGYENTLKRLFNSAKEITACHRSSDLLLGSLLNQEARNIFNLPFDLNIPCQIDTAVLSHTENCLPCIAQLGRNYYCCVGGNGCGACPSDEIGRLVAVKATTNQWNCVEFEENWFENVEQRLLSKL